LRSKKGMIKVEISESDRSLLKELRYTSHHPRVMCKMDALYMKSLDIDNKLICKILDICPNSLLEYIRQYKRGGIEELSKIKFNKPCSELKVYSGSIEEYFTLHPPASIAEASAKIEKLTGIKRGETQVRKFLKSLKFRYIKTGSVPAKALTEEKKTNRENFWIKNLTLE